MCLNNIVDVAEDERGGDLAQGRKMPPHRKKGERRYCRTIKPRAAVGATSVSARKMIPEDLDNNMIFLMKTTERCDDETFFECSRRCFDLDRRRTPLTFRSGGPYHLSSWQ